MTEIRFENIPDDISVYMSFDGKTPFLCSGFQEIDISIGEHTISVICQNRRNIKFKLDHLTPRHEGAFLPYCFNYEILSFKYDYKIKIFRSDSILTFRYDYVEYKNFLRYKSKKHVLVPCTKKMYILDDSGPIFINKKQKIKFEFLQISNVAISMLPYFMVLLFLICVNIRLIKNGQDVSTGGYRSLSPSEGIFLVLIPFMIVLLILAGYLIYRLFKETKSYKG